MSIEPSLLASTSILLGASIGGAASLSAAIYSQWYQHRVQRLAREAVKREAVYAEFIMSASKVQVRAYMSDKLTWSADEQHLIGVINRMRLFAPKNVIDEAEKVIRSLIQISLQPSVDAAQLARTALSDRSAPDLLLDFSLASQADLEVIYGRATQKPTVANLGNLGPVETGAFEPRSAPPLRVVSRNGGEISNRLSSLGANRA